MPRSKQTEPEIEEEAGADSQPRRSTRTKSQPSQKNADDAEHDSGAEEQDENEFLNDAMDSDGEAIPEIPSRKKKAGKEPGKTKQSKGPRARKAALAEDASLFDIVVHGGALEVTATEWLERYQRDSTGALVELVNFLFQSSGSKKPITADDLDLGDVPQVITNQIEEYEEGGDNAFLEKGNYKGFRNQFRSFWTHLISKARNEPLYDDTLFETIHNWTVQVSSATLRSFRTGATVAGLAIIGALVDVAATLFKESTIAQRQLDGTRGGQASKALERDIDRIGQRQKATVDMIDKMFTGIFVHRYRDVQTDIRADCIKALGKWITTLPTHFLKDSFLKYLGWTLNDLDPHVRKTSLSSIGELYNSRYVTQLETFTKRFRVRIIEMCTDVDSTVNVEANKVATILLGHNLLEQSEIDRVYTLISSVNPNMRDQAAAFVYEHLLNRVVDQQAPNLSASEREEVQLRAIAQFISEISAQPQRPEEIIDALWDKTNILYNWEKICNLMLTDDSEEILNDGDITALTLMLVAAARKSVGQIIVTDAGAEVKKTKKKGESEASRTLTIKMAKFLPRLLVKFQAEPQRIEALVEIIGLLDLTVITAERLTKHLQEILDFCADIVFKATELTTIGEVLKSLNILAAAESSVKSKIQDTLANIQHEATTRVTKAVKAHATKKGSEKTAAAADVEVGFLRLSLLNQYNTIDAETFGTFRTVLEKAKERGYSQKTLIQAYSSMVFSTMWEIKEFIDLKATAGELKEIIEKRDILQQLTTSLLEDGDDHVLPGILPVYGALLVFLKTQAHLSQPISEEVSRMCAEAAERSIQNYSQLVTTRANALERLAQSQASQTDVSPSEDELNEAYTVVQKMLRVIQQGIAHGNLNWKCAHIVIAHLEENDGAFRSILREILQNVRTMYPSEEWECVLEALKSAFNFYKQTDNKEEEWPTVSKLATALARSYQGVKDSKDGFDLKKAMGNLMRVGIEFAFEEAPDNLQFLEALTPFLKPLQTKAKEAILTLFDAARRDLPDHDEEGDDWAPIENFRQALSASAGAAKGAGVKKERKAPGSVRRSPKNDDDDDDLAPASASKSARRLDLTSAAGTPAGKGTSKGSAAASSAGKKRAREEPVAEASRRSGRARRDVTYDKDDEEEVDEEEEDERPAKKAKTSSSKKPAKEDTPPPSPPPSPKAAKGRKRKTDDVEEEDAPTQTSTVVAPKRKQKPTIFESDDEKEAEKEKEDDSWLEEPSYKKRPTKLQDTQSSLPPSPKRSRSGASAAAASSSQTQSQNRRDASPPPRRSTRG